MSGTSDTADGRSGFLAHDELLDGPAARRASALLLAIESRTAQLVARSRRAMARHHTERSAQEHDHAHLDVVAQGPDSSLEPTVQGLERDAPDWQALVPDDAVVCAAVAGLLSEQCVLCEVHVPQIRGARGLDEPEVQVAYERQPGRHLATIYSTRTGARG